MYTVTYNNSSKKDLKHMKKNGSEARAVKEIEEMKNFLIANGPNIIVANQEHPDWKAEQLKVSGRNVFSFRIDRGNRFTFELLGNNEIVVLGVKGHYSTVTTIKEMIMTEENKEEFSEEKAYEQLEDMSYLIGLFYSGVISYSDLVMNAEENGIAINPRFDYNILSDTNKDTLNCIREKMLASNYLPSDIHSIKISRGSIEFTIEKEVITEEYEENLTDSQEPESSLNSSTFGKK